MPRVVEEIPGELRAEVDAALAWINAEGDSAFRVTGIVDPEETLARRGDADGFDLGLVLCQGDLCRREQVRVRRSGDEIQCAPVDSPRSDDPPPLLDPPAGTRNGWLAGQLARHAFVVVVFYRGFW
ncbi:MAG: hypothetical protein HRU01_28160 [Myxococcales bacterium]|nr:hypothetical protein [Myxococcales bacterium]